MGKSSRPGRTRSCWPPGVLTRASTERGRSRRQRKAPHRPQERQPLGLIPPEPPPPPVPPPPVPPPVPPLGAAGAGAGAGAAVVVVGVGATVEVVVGAVVVGTLTVPPPDGLGTSP